MREPCTVIVHSGRKCGSYYAGTVLLCDYHRAEAKVAYPQGWVGYPGDTCRHGIYVGGCGVDRMCGTCESGED